MIPADLRTQRQLRHAVCSALNCRRRKDLIPTKAMIFGLLVEVDLCRKHETEYVAALHEKFRDAFDGVDFVDPERN